MTTEISVQQKLIPLYGKQQIIVKDLSAAQQQQQELSVLLSGYKSQETEDDSTDLELSNKIQEIENKKGIVDRLIETLTIKKQSINDEITTLEETPDSQTEGADSTYRNEQAQKAAIDLVKRGGIFTQFSDEEKKTILGESDIKPTDMNNNNSIETDEFLAAAKMEETDDSPFESTSGGSGKPQETLGTSGAQETSGAQNTPPTPPTQPNEPPRDPNIPKRVDVLENRVDGLEGRLTALEGGNGGGQFNPAQGGQGGNGGGGGGFFSGLLGFLGNCLALPFNLLGAVGNGLGNLAGSIGGAIGGLFNRTGGGSSFGFGGGATGGGGASRDVGPSGGGFTTAGGSGGGNGGSGSGIFGGIFNGIFGGLSKLGNGFCNFIGWNKEPSYNTFNSLGDSTKDPGGSSIGRTLRSTGEVLSFGLLGDLNGDGKVDALSALGAAGSDLVTMPIRGAKELYGGFKNRLLN